MFRIDTENFDLSRSELSYSIAFYSLLVLVLLAIKSV